MKYLKSAMFAAMAGLPLAVLPAMAATSDNPATTVTKTTMPDGTTTTALPNGSPVTRDGTTYMQTGTAVTPTAPTGAAGGGGSGK